MSPRNNGTILPLHTIAPSVPETAETTAPAVPADGYWRSHGPALSALGYDPVPLKRGTKKPAKPGWREDRYISTDRALLRGFRGSGVGVKTGTVVAIDIDCDDPEAGEQHVAWCNENLGSGLRRDGRRGTMLFYRTSEPGQKVTSHAYMAPGHERPQRLEVLGVGQQAAVYVEHPDNGRPYYSYPGGELTDKPLGELTEISKAQRYAAVDHFESLARAAGWAQVLHGADRIDGGEHKAGNDPHAELWLLEAALAVIPTPPGWKEWNHVAMALHRATDGSEEAFELFDKWSRRGVGYDGGGPARERWEALERSPPNNIGAGTIFHMANEADPGWRKRAEAARDVTHPGWREREQAEKDEQMRRSLERLRPGGAGGDTHDDDQDPLPMVPLDVVSMASFHGSSAPPRRWVVEEMIPDRTVTDLSGDGGTGKSLLALQLAVAVAAGRPWLSRAATLGKVLYVSCEDELTEVRRRVEAIVASEAGLSLADLSELQVLDLTVTADTELAVTGTDRQTLEMTGLFYQLATKVAELQPKLVIIDTRADVFGGNEISRVQVRAFVRQLKQLCAAQGLAVLLLSHPSVTGLSSGSGQSGSTAWGNSVRSRLYLEKAEGDDPDLRTLKTKKANYGAADAEIALRWRAGVFELTGGTVEGKPLDREQQERRVEARFIELLREFEKAGRHVNDAGGPYYAPRLFADADPTIGKGNFAGAMRRLFAQGRLKVVPFGPPSRGTKKIVEVAS